MSRFSAIPVIGYAIMLGSIVPMFTMEEVFLPCAFVLLGAVITCTGFSVIIAKNLETVRGRYLDRIRIAAGTLDEQDTDKIASMTASASPMTWKLPAIRNITPSFFIAGAIILLVFPVDSIIEAILNVAINVSSIIMSMAVFRPAVTTAVKRWSTATLLERVATRLESRC